MGLQEFSRVFLGFYGILVVQEFRMAGGLGFQGLGV